MSPSAVESCPRRGTFWDRGIKGGSSRLPLGEERANILLLACCYQEGSNPQHGSMKTLPRDGEDSKRKTMTPQLDGVLPSLDMGAEMETKTAAVPGSRHKSRPFLR